MIYWTKIVTLQRCALLVLALAGCCFGDATAAASGAQKLDGLLTRTGNQVSAFLDQFSDVKCTELVRQEKLGKDDKVELKEESTYDYLVILTNSGGELSLSESRLPIRAAKPDGRNTSMLLSNGFATLFLVFHPLYADSFKFAFEGEDTVDGHLTEKVSFQHVRWDAIGRRPRPARPGISPGAFRHRMDRSGNRHHRQDRGRNREHHAGCRVEVSPRSN